MKKKSPKYNVNVGFKPAPVARFSVYYKTIPGLSNAEARMKRIGMTDPWVTGLVKKMKQNTFIDAQLGQIVANKIRYEESKHPRHAKGTPQGGQFKTKGVAAKGKSHGKVSKSKGV